MKLSWDNFLILMNHDQWLSIPIILITSIILVGMVKLPMKIVIKKLRHWSSRTSLMWDDIAVDMLEKLKSLTHFIWIGYLLTSFINLSQGGKRAFDFFFILITLFQVVIWGLHLISHWKDTVLKKHMDENNSSAGALGLIYAGIQVSFIITISLIGLSNLGVDIGALIAGLGVGGIAVALAAQNILGDLLASLSIVLDKPFVIGDFIVVGNEKGTVEQIGIKTTRLRSVSGEQLVFSNKDLLESRISNFKRMTERRVVKQLGIDYETGQDLIVRVPKIIQEIIDEQPTLKFDRCHLSNLGTSSLDYELVFLVKGPDYQVYMDAQEIVLQKIYARFKELGIALAFPSQTVYIKK
ncbi:MAG: mechanosensitive ion channel family protein [Bacteriovoracaceae bacterium]|nr:mechanosensitive ion channel family protein [Bacteriovoracaceae bacterium]